MCVFLVTMLMDAACHLIRLAWIRECGRLRIAALAGDEEDNHSWRCHEVPLRWYWPQC